MEALSLSVSLINPHDPALQRNALFQRRVHFEELSLLSWNNFLSFHIRSRFSFLTANENVNMNKKLVLCVCDSFFCRMKMFFWMNIFYWQWQLTSIGKIELTKLCFRIPTLHKWVPEHSVWLIRAHRRLTKKNVGLYMSCHSQDATLPMWRTKRRAQR